MTKRILLLTAAIGAFVGTIERGQAASTTSTLGVSATAAAACTLTAAPVAFGTLSTSAATSATGSVTVNCTNGDALTIALDAGTSASGSQRRLVNAGNYLNYSLYQPTAAGTAESSPAVAWGDGTALGSTFGTTSTGAAQVFNVYGSVPSGQTLYVGAYTDTVTVTLSY
jgi:spore coat protein U-like protein